jgi:hypothetical protein
VIFRQTKGFSLSIVVCLFLRCCDGQVFAVVSRFCCGLFQFSMLVFVALLFAQVVFLDTQVAAKMMNEGRAKIAHTP